MNGAGGRVPPPAGDRGARAVAPRPGQAPGGVPEAHGQAGARGRVDPHARPRGARAEGAPQHPGAGGALGRHPLVDDGAGREADGLPGQGQAAGEQGVLAPAQPVAGVEAQTQPAHDDQVQQQVAGVRAGHAGAVVGPPGVEGAAGRDPRVRRLLVDRRGGAGHRRAAVLAPGGHQGPQPALARQLVVVDEDQQVLVAALAQRPVAAGDNAGHRLVNAHEARPRPGCGPRGLCDDGGRTGPRVVVDDEDARADLLADLLGLSQQQRQELGEVGVAPIRENCHSQARALRRLTHRMRARRSIARGVVAC